MILILSDKFDRHADIVTNKLLSRKEDFFRFDLDVESLKKSSINFEGGIWTIKQKDKTITSNQIKCVWVRRPFVELTLQEREKTDADFKIWKGEWNKTLIGLYNSLRNLPWLNPLRKSFKAENKYLQMEIAHNIGFKMPRTLISNNRQKILEFYSKEKDVVLKLMNQDFYKDEKGDLKGIYVNKLNKTSLLKFKEFGENPIVLQKYVPKMYEVRYTVVGKDHFVCKIDSQKSEISKTDWRRYDIPNTPYSVITPPERIKCLVCDFMKKFEIEFGALDFIITPENEWYFLEINSMGQWLWIEDLVNLKISDSIVLWLIENK